MIKILNTAQIRDADAYTILKGHIFNPINGTCRKCFCAAVYSRVPRQE